MTAQTKKETNAKKELACLVAGGAGFIGSYLCEALLAQDYKVYCLDNLSTGSKENIKELLTKPNFHFIEADITQPVELFDSVEDLDSIFHLAALEVAEGEKDFSLETLLVNSTGTRNLLEGAKKFGAKFVLVSSGDIYQGSFSSNSLKYFFGASEEAEMSQNEAKRFAEALTVEYYKNYQLKATIVRVKDVYGPRMSFRTHNELNRLVGQAKEGEKLSVKGDGLTTLSPTYVSDVVFGLVKVLHGEFQGEIFNLISSEKTTEKGLAETLRLISGNLDIVNVEEEKKITIPPPPLDMENTKEKLKWAPRVTLAEGLSSIFQSFREFAPAKMVSLTGPIEERPEPERVSQGQKSVWGRRVRPVIFILSLLLIVLTVVVPFVLFVVQTRAAAQNLDKAFSALNADQSSVTSDQADAAVARAQAADQNLNNVRWLFQLTGKRNSLRSNEQLSFAQSNTASGLKLLAQVTKDLIDAENETDSQKAQDLLTEASQSLAQARQDLDLAQVSLGQVSSKTLLVGLSADFKKTEDIVDQAAGSAESISSSLTSVLESFSPGSTNP